jgi:hypothetical protein
MCKGAAFFTFIGRFFQLPGRMLMGLMQHVFFISFLCDRLFLFSDYTDLKPGLHGVKNGYWRHRACIVRYEETRQVESGAAQFKSGGRAPYPLQKNL